MKKGILILFLTICVFFTLSSVCASDVNDTIVTSDDNQFDLSQDVTDDNLKSNEIDEIITASPETFSSLNDTINGNDDQDIYLDSDYTFESGSDDVFKKGITISRAVTVYGNGHVIDGVNQSHIFIVQNSSVVFRDIVFQNAYGDGQFDYGVAIDGPATAINCTFINNYGNGGASKGGAMNDGNAIDCIFIENKAGDDGGAIYMCNATNCVFLRNEATWGGAASNSNMIDCIFMANTGKYGGATYKGSATNCIFLSNHAWDSGDDYMYTTVENCSSINSANLNASDFATVPYSGEKQMITLTADNGKILNRVPVKVSIKRDSEEIGTYYGLSGYGWVVNLGPGNYFAIFSIPNANVAGKTISINISSGTSFMDLDYIINKKYLDNSTIYLDTDYAYENTTVFNGIVIDRNLTLDGKGHKIDGKNLARIFYVTSDAAVTFNNITFINGHAEGSQYGGAILAESEDKVKATHCEFRDNIAYRGGAVCRVDCYKCYFVSNKADNGKEYAYGGAIYSGDAVNCTFMSNEAKYGGAIYDGDAVNSEFRGNKAMFGGAISGCYAINCIFESNDASSSGGAIYQGNAEDCHFEHNTAVNDGGAIYRGNATGSYFDRNVAHMGGAISDCDATDCTFKRNTANAGGAIYGRTAENCTFENNSANETGGAIYCGMAINSIFSDNSAKQMGGAIYDGSAYDSTFTGNKANYDGGAIYNGNAINCIFTNNTADHNGGAICKGNVVSSTFTANYAGMEGGAIHGDKANNQYSTAVDCIFNNNTAEYNGGAMAYGNATNCSFTGNDVNIGNGTAMYGKGEYPCNALNCVFTNNNADKQVIRYGIADSCIFNGDTPGSDVVVLKPVLSVSNFISTYNDGSVLVVNVTSASGMPIANARIKVDVYTITGTFVGTYIISSSGWKVPLNAGNYIATFNATDYGSDTVQGIIVVNKDKTAVTSGAVSTVYNKDKYLVITLKDSKGNALSGESVTVTLGSEKTYKTDKNGQIRINVGKVVPKTYNAKISFAGSTNYLASSTTAKVVVKKASPKLTAKAKTFKKKVKIKKYTITLKNNVGKAIKKVRVTIKIKKKTYRAKTNVKGKATFKIKKLTKKGTYKATVAFKGNAYYNKVTKKVKIKIK